MLQKRYARKTLERSESERARQTLFAGHALRIYEGIARVLLKPGNAKVSGGLPLRCSVVVVVVVVPMIVVMVTMVVTMIIVPMVVSIVVMVEAVYRMRHVSKRIQYPQQVVDSMVTATSRSCVDPSSAGEKQYHRCQGSFGHFSHFSCSRIFVKSESLVAS